jgi:hypothetical protein
MRVVASCELTWRGDKLCFGQRAVVSIVPDDQYPTMWRVQQPDGTISDMVNKMRARDAARSIALSILNRQETGAGRAITARIAIDARRAAISPSAWLPRAAPAPQGSKPPLSPVS